MYSRIFLSGTIRNLAIKHEKQVLAQLVSQQTGSIQRCTFSTRIRQWNTTCHSYWTTRRHQSVTPIGDVEKPDPKKKQIMFLNWRSVAVMFIFGTATLLFMYKLKSEKEESIKRQRKQAIGKMAIGGPFELVDHNGKPCKSSDFIGKWLLIYFGFTHCPDICPEELEKMCHAVDLVEKVDIKGARIQPLFISIDPDRDDVKTVAKYIKDFSSKLIGLTGSRDQIESVAKAYRVYFSAGPKDEDKDYIVDHTVIMYLVDPEGNFVDYFGQNKTDKEIATAVAIHMGSYQKGLQNKAEPK